MPGQGGMDGVRTLERESPGSCVCGCEWPEGAGVLVEVMAWRLWATALGADLGLCLWPGGSGCVAPLKGPAQRLVRGGERAGGQGGSASSWKNSMPAWNHVKLEPELSRQFLAALVAGPWADRGRRRPCIASLHAHPRRFSPVRLWSGWEMRRPQGSAVARRGTRVARGGAGQRPLCADACGPHRCSVNRCSGGSCPGHLVSRAGRKLSGDPSPPSLEWRSRLSCRQRVRPGSEALAMAAQR